MIRPLRHRHRVLVIVMGITMPFLFVIAIARRPQVPVMRSLPASLGAKP